ncbi:MAG: hypothetical protein K2X86_06250 [Cytophagaceae bacterium]|nr:hypothetical protein [Cytophagaceae bacterium]
MNKGNDEKWWVEVLIGLGIVFIGFIFFVYGLPQKVDGWGYKTKLGALLFKFIEELGGKWLIIIVCSVIGIRKIYLGFKRK